MSSYTVYGHGGILNNLVEFSPNSCIAWLLEIACLGAVNIYALITGYVYINSTHKYSKFLNLWLSVFFYSFFITLIYKFLTPNIISITTLIKSAFPIITKQYWYFSSYFCLFIFIPFINILIKNLSKQQHKFLIYCIIFCFCVLNFASTILGLDIFNLNGGYSFLWLMSLYIIGAYLKLYENDFNKYNKNKFLYAYILSVCITFLLRFLSKCIKFKLLGIFSNSGGMFISYISPFILLSAISLVLFFARLKFKNTTKKIILKLSKLSFGVYLIHEQNLIRSTFIKNRFCLLAQKTPIVILSNVLIKSFIIFTCCLFIEWIRQKIFEILKVNQICEKITENIKNIIYKKIIISLGGNQK